MEYSDTKLTTYTHPLLHRKMYFACHFQHRVFCFLCKLLNWYKLWLAPHGAISTHLSKPLQFVCLCVCVWSGCTQPQSTPYSWVMEFHVCVFIQIIHPAKQYPLYYCNMYRNSFVALPWEKLTPWIQLFALFWEYLLKTIKSQRCFL